MESQYILIVSDTPALFEDLKKSLSSQKQVYELDLALNEDEALDKVMSALKKGNPYALIFIGVHGGPGLDGISTIKKIWEKAPNTQIIMCMTKSDFSFQDIINQLGASEYLLFLMTPFDVIEVQQLVFALTTKNKNNQFDRIYIENLEALIKEKALEIETERLRSLQSSKFATLGEMAAGIAHEINNPLAIIQSNIGFMKETLDKEFDKVMFLKIADKIEATTMRVAKIIKGLRKFARSGDKDPLEVVSIEQTIQETLGICTEKFKIHDVTLEFVKPVANYMIDCRQTQLIQVFLNLLNNAYDAVQDYPEKWVKIEINELKDAAAEVWVTDSGKGIPEEIQKKLFHSFFTTKDIGKGTGLGLSLSKEIINEHNGILSIDNTCINTRFVVRLPVKKSTLVSSKED